MASADVAMTVASHVALRALPALLRDEPGLTRALGDPSARLAVPEVARPISIAALAAARRAAAAGRRLPDRHDGRPAVRRPAPVPARRTRSSTVPGVGDAAVRARQPQRRDDGPAPRGAVAAARPRARARRSSSPACGRCCSGSGPGATTIEPIVVRPGAIDRPRRAARARSSSSATGARTWSSTAARSPARRDRRRLPVDRRRPDPHRPVGRRGRPADDVRRQRPALASATSTRCCIFPARELLPDRRGARARRRAGRRASRGAASSGSGSPRAPTSTAWSRGCRGSSTTTQLLTDLLPDDGQGRARRAAADARPGRRPARRGGRPRPARSRRRGRATPTRRSRACTPTPTGCSRERGSVLDDRLDARVARHARSSQASRLGPGRSATATGSPTA